MAPKKRAPSTPVKAKKGAKKAKVEEKEEEPKGISIQLQQVRLLLFSLRPQRRWRSGGLIPFVTFFFFFFAQAVTLTFSIKYLSNFAKSTPLSKYVVVRPFLPFHPSLSP